VSGRRDAHRRRPPVALEPALALARGFALAGVLLTAAGGAGCSRPTDEEAVRRVVRAFAEHVERGRVGRAVDLLGDDFRLEGRGWDRADVRRELDLRVRFLRRTGDGGFRIVLAPESFDVFLEGAGADAVAEAEFEALVFEGALRPESVDGDRKGGGSADEVPLERLRVEAELRRVRGRFRFSAATVR